MKTDSIKERFSESLRGWIVPIGDSIPDRLLLLGEAGGALGDADA